MIAGNVADGRSGGKVGRSQNGGGDGHHGGQRRGRAQQAKKRATFPLINSKIIVAADTGDLMLLLTTIEANLPQMNLVNLSTAFHRVAKLCAGDAAAQIMLHKQQVLPNMVSAVQNALERAEQNGAPPQCQALSNITWALATVFFVDMKLLTLCAEIGRRHVKSFKPFELSSTLWAFSRLGGLQLDACECAAPFFAAAADQIATKTSEFSFRCLVMVAYAYAAAGHGNEALFCRIGELLVPSLHSASSQELEQATWAFGSAVSHNPRTEKFFADFARRGVGRLGELKPQELCSMLWSFSAARFFCEEFFENAVVTVKFLDLQALQLATLAVSIGWACPEHRIAQGTLLKLLPRCCQVLESLTAQEITAVVWGAAKTFGKTGGALPQTVTDFFTAVLPWIRVRLPEFSGRCLAQIAASFVHLELGSDTELFPSIGFVVLGQAQVLDTPALLLLLRCLPAIPRCACTGAACMLFSEVVRRFDTFHAQDLQDLSQICSRLLDLHRSSLSREEILSCCNVLSQAGPMRMAQAKTRADDIEHVLWVEPPFLQQQAGLPLTPPRGAAAATSRRNVVALGDGAGGRIAAAVGAPQHVPVQGGVVGPLATALGKTSPKDAWQTGSPPKTGNLPNFEISIKNTFVDIGGGGEEQDQSPSKPLPPPLDFIPPTVSGEKLAAYRMDYQNFRAGKAVGAKGEVSDKVNLEMALDLALTDAQESVRGGWPPGSAEGFDSPLRVDRVVDETDSFESPAQESKKVDLPTANLPTNSFSVKNTFLHIPDASVSEGDSDSDEPVRLLPPPLPCIDIAKVSEEKLAAYRQDYQNFRAGKSHGAKGEVSSSVALDLAADDTTIELAQKQVLKAAEDELGSKEQKYKPSGRRRKGSSNFPATAPGQPAFVQLSSESQPKGAFGTRCAKGQML